MKWLVIERGGGWLSYCVVNPPQDIIRDVIDPARTA
jgi:hypothetical protein